VTHLADLRKVTDAHGRVRTITYHDAYIPESYFGYGAAFVEAYIAWLKGHGIEPRWTHRTEHLVIDAPLVRVYQVAHEGGRILADPVTGDIAYLEPFDVLIRFDPPRPEDYP
jgi:hypothetical protein